MGEAEPFDPKELAAAGWRRRSVAAEPRLGEAVELYRSLGHEVLLVPVLRERGPEGAPGTCTACFSADEDPDRYRVIYTRPKPGAEDTPEGLFE